MKSFAKLGLLLFLVVVGRYLRPASSVAFPNPEKNSVVLAKPDSLQFATYTTSQVSPMAPVSHRSTKPRSSSEDYSIWY